MVWRWIRAWVPVIRMPRLVIVLVKQGHDLSLGLLSVSVSVWHVRTLLDGEHDGGEVVVDHDHVGRLLGHVCAAPTHGQTNVRLLHTHTQPN